MLGLAVTDDLFDRNRLPVEEFKLSDLLGLPIDENNTPSGTYDPLTSVADEIT